MNESIYLANYAHYISSGAESKANPSDLNKYKQPLSKGFVSTALTWYCSAMANTTVKGALAIHGQNPQVYIYIYSLCSALSYLFSS